MYFELSFDAFNRQFGQLRQQRGIDMTAYVATWEVSLLDRAYTALENHSPLKPLDVTQDKLEQAYRYSEALTRQHSRTFHLASALLPYSERRAARALYGFCRISDDLVDEARGNPQTRLQAWRRISLSSQPSPDDSIALAWADARAKYGIPRQYADQLIDGVAQDISITRYQTFEHLASYCYGVASTVGLMAMHIIGFTDTDAIPYAIKLGVALQMTNILRDVGEDWRIGRLYLPQDELADFHLTEADIEAGRVDDRWRAFMRYQIQRTRTLYRDALPGIALLNPRGRFAIAAAAELYSAILDDIERHDYDVFNRRAHSSGLQKLRHLPGIWWRARQASTDRYFS